MATGTAYCWFESYLTGRKQFVVCKGLESDTIGLNYGVPQGSVLGPSLFSIHYDGLQASVEQSHCMLYADDTEIQASNASATTAAARVNYDLKNIDQWLFENLIIWPCLKRTGNDEIQELD